MNRSKTQTDAPGLYIDGEWTLGGGRIIDEVINPEESDPGSEGGIEGLDAYLSTKLISIE